MFPNLNSGRLTAFLYMYMPASSTVILMVIQDRRMHEGIAHTTEDTGWPGIARSVD